MPVLHPHGYRQRYVFHRLNLPSITNINYSQLKKLNCRTGTAGLVVTTRGHINDSIAPTVFETDNASGFCQKALGHALFDIGTRLESWTILQGQSKSKKKYRT